MVINSDPDEALLLDLLPKCLHIVFNSDEIDTINTVFDRALEFNSDEIDTVNVVLYLN
ncbi:hypothetical protein Hanom_Chr09g00842191 [Helianthus anomalus]